jgi:hypothetical protein
VTHLPAQVGVEVGQRLIEQEDGGFPDDSPSHGDALPLPAGHLLRFAIEERMELQDLRRPANPAVDLPFRNLPQAQTQGDVLTCREVGVEGVVLKHHGHVALPGRQVRDLPLTDADRSARDALEPREHPQDRRFAAPGSAHEDHQLAIGHLKVEPLVPVLAMLSMK